MKMTFQLFWPKKVWCTFLHQVGDIVAECSTDISEATADTLDEVMDCGKETVGEFVKENASPKMMEKIAKMFGDKDDDDDDDDDDE